MSTLLNSMSTTKIFLLVTLTLMWCFCEIQCKRSARSRGSRSRHGAHDLNVQYGSANRSLMGQPEVDEDNPTKVGSAPTALDSRFNSPPKVPGFDQVNRQAVDPLLSPNPQKPTGWNMGGFEPAPNNNDFRLRALTGHFQSSTKINLRSYPNTAYPDTGSYNYYGVSESYNYGNGYQSHNAKQPFPGYRETSNIGVIPPKGINVADYYGNMLGYANMPKLSNNAGVFERLFGGQKQGPYGNYGFGNNAYKNVLAGLLIWNLMHGLTNYRFNVYNHYNQPEMIPKNMSLSASNIVECPKNVTMICETSTKALCTTNSTIFCISSPKRSCISESNNADQDSTDLACVSSKNCVTNITILSETESENVFCVTTFAVPQVPDDDEDACKSGNAERCLPSTSPKNEAEDSIRSSFQLNITKSVTTTS